MPRVPFASRVGVPCAPSAPLAWPPLRLAHGPIRPSISAVGAPHNETYVFCKDGGFRTKGDVRSLTVQAGMHLVPKGHLRTHTSMQNPPPPGGACTGRGRCTQPNRHPVGNFQNQPHPLAPCPSRRAFMVPFLAHRAMATRNISYKWIMYGDDDTLYNIRVRWVTAYPKWGITKSSHVLSPPCRLLCAGKRSNPHRWM